MKEKIAGLDGLRGIAIFGIAFLYHYSVVLSGGQDESRIISFLCTYAWLGVEVFFCLSGFLMAYNFNSIDEDISLLSFVGKRLKKIWPLAICSTVFCAIEVIFYTCLDLPIFKNMELYNTLLDFGFNLVGVQTSFFPHPETSGQTFNLPLWFLSVLIICYAWYYIYMHIDKKYRMSALIVVCGFFAWVIIHNFMQCNFFIINYPTARGMVAFSLGVIVEQLYQKKVINSKRVMTGCFISVLVWICICIKNVNLLGNLIISFDLFVAVPMVILCTCNRAVQKIMEMYPLKWLGKISFSIFVWNFPIEILFLILSCFISIDFSNILIWLIHLIITLGVAQVSYKVFGK